MRIKYEFTQDELIAALRQYIEKRFGFPAELTASMDMVYDDGTGETDYFLMEITGGAHCSKDSKGVLNQ